MLRVVIVFGLLAIVGGVATWRPDLAEQAYLRAPPRRGGRPSRPFP